MSPNPTPAGPVEPSAAPVADQLVESDLLVEDVSIDGMCGVY
jgi:mycofactocin precursor